MISKIIKYVAMAFALIVIAITAMGIASIESAEDVGSKAMGLFNTSINLTKVMIYICLFALVVGVVISLVFNPKQGVLLVAALVGLAVVIGIAYALSPGGAVPANLVPYGISEGGWKWVGAGVYSIFILIGLAVVAMLVDAVKGAFLNN